VAPAYSDKEMIMSTGNGNDIPFEGLVGAMQRAMYGPGGPPQVKVQLPPPVPRSQAVVQLAGTVLVLALIAAALFGTALGCYAAWMAVTS